MENQSDIDKIEMQITAIKSNSEYQRLLTSQRGLKDDQRLKAYTLKLQTLMLKKNKISVDNKYTPNIRNMRSIRKPEVSNNVVFNKPQDTTVIVVPKTQIIEPPIIEEPLIKHRTKLNKPVETKVEQKPLNVKTRQFKGSVKNSQPIIKNNKNIKINKNNIETIENIEDIDDLDINTMDNLLEND